jgi:DNA-binding winged helix-turn-helix (wHTH) protein
MLLERPGELITREELRAVLWPSDTFVDFEHGVNAAIRRLREALGDSADNPHLIETLPRRGYRFVGTIGTNPKESSDGPPPVTLSPPIAAVSPLQSRRAIARMASLVLILMLFSAGTWVLRHRTAKPADDTSILSAVPFTGYPGVVVGASFSPDGNQIAFFWDGKNEHSDVYVKMIGADTSRRLTSDPAGSSFPAWSPDGATIAFSRPRSGGGSAIILIPASGGAERKLTDNNASWVGTALSWSRDAKYLALADRNSADSP